MSERQEIGEGFDQEDYLLSLADTLRAFTENASKAADRFTHARAWGWREIANRAKRLAIDVETMIDWED